MKSAARMPAHYWRDVRVLANPARKVFHRGINSLTMPEGTFIKQALAEGLRDIPLGGEGSRLLHAKPSDVVLDAVFKMSSRNVGALCVGERTDRGVRLEGVLSERDLITKIGSSVTKVSGNRVTEIMTPASAVTFARSDDSLMGCLKTMLTGNFRHLPVKEDEDMVSMISIKDIAWKILRHLEDRHPKVLGTIESDGSSVKDLFIFKHRSTGEDAAFITGNASVFDAIEMMSSHDIGALIVKGQDSGDLVGIVSERDYMCKIIMEFDAREQSVSHVMTPKGDMVCAKADSSVFSLLQAMVERNIRHIPIIDDDGQHIAVVSIRDILHFILSLSDQGSDKEPACQKCGMPNVHTTECPFN